MAVQQDQEEAEALAEMKGNTVDGVSLHGYRSPREQDNLEEDEGLVYFINANASMQDDESAQDSLLYVIRTQVDGATAADHCDG